MADAQQTSADKRNPQGGVMELNLSSRVQDNLKEQVSTGISNINQEFKEREVKIKAQQMALGYVYLLETPINPDVLLSIPKEVSQVAKIIPFYHMGKKLRVAFTNPNGSKTGEVIKVLSQKYEIEKFLCSEESLVFAQKNYEKQFYQSAEEIRARVDEDTKVDFEDEIRKAKEIPKKMEGQRTDIALNMLHEVVVRMSVSDIHFQPMEKSVIIRARVDGMLREIMTIKHDLALGLTRQIKHDAHLKYNITNIPQDGKYAFIANERKVDVRVSTMPTVYGESVVLRFLDSKKGIVPLDDLGFGPRLQGNIEEGIFGTGGMMIVTGPTGSGKTTTLYSSIAKINTPEKKIVTLEDPVEFRLPGILQSNVHEDAGYTFSSGLKALLRQDPDVILIGEIRNKDTGEAAVQAALTGHVVFSTLHTNSAADAIPRLMNMGLAAFVLAPALRMVLAQRLVRTICKKCKKERPITSEERAMISEVLERIRGIGIDHPLPENLFEGEGCETCGGSGYRGQTAVLEILKVDEKIQELIFTDFSSTNINRTAKENGMLTMWEEGAMKIINGETTYEEIRRKIEKH